MEPSSIDELLEIMEEIATTGYGYFEIPPKDCKTILDYIDKLKEENNATTKGK
jgi:hypothetical protein